MSIYTVDNDLPNTTKIKLLNDMISELNVKFEQGKFDKNEIDIIYDTIVGARKYQRNVGLGNTLTTYTGWSHIQAETGYSIWKYTPTTYAYDSTNKMYMNSKVIENRGEASAESASAFDFAYLWNGDSGSGFVNNTTEAGTPNGTAFEVMNTKNDYMYVGLDSTFGGIKFEWQTRGSNYTLRLDYWTGTAWIQLTANVNDLEESTSNFQSDGHITYTIPTNWNTVAVNGQTKYWIRISSTTDPVTVAQAYYIIPSNSIVGLLALSSTEIQKEEWAWGTFSSSVYVTIPNVGAGSVEGTNFITSASSTTNLKNYFIYNKPFTADYKSSLYAPSREMNSNTSILETDGPILADASVAGITLTLPAAHTRDGMAFLIKKVDSSGNSVTIATESGETIDGAGSVALSAQWKYKKVLSDNGNYYIIGEN